MRSTSSMIDELDDTISHQDENIASGTYQRTLFPAPATNRENHQSLGKHTSSTTAYVCHEPTGANSVQTTSNLRKNRFRETISLSPCAAICMRCCNFSTDLVEKANSGHLPATCQLRETSVRCPLVNI